MSTLNMGTVNWYPNNKSFWVDPTGVYVMCPTVDAWNELSEHLRSTGLILSNPPADYFIGRVLELSIDGGVRVTVKDIIYVKVVKNYIEQHEQSLAKLKSILMIADNGDN